MCIRDRYVHCLSEGRNCVLFWGFVPPVIWHASCCTDYFSFSFCLLELTLHRQSLCRCPGFSHLEHFGLPSYLSLYCSVCWVAVSLYFLLRLCCRDLLLCTPYDWSSQALTWRLQTVVMHILLMNCLHYSILLFIRIPLVHRL